MNLSDAKKSYYQVVYADPPWHYSSGIRSSKKVEGKYQYYTPETTIGASYETQSEDWLSKLPIKEICAEDCILFMWTTDSHLPVSLRVMASWGFTYRTIAFIWNKKESSGKQVCYYGKYTMKGSEICLLGTIGKGHSLIKSHKVRQLVEATRDRSTHSKKPNEVRERIVQLVGNIPKIELFAREEYPGWDAWGNQV